MVSRISSFGDLLCGLSKGILHGLHMGFGEVGEVDLHAVLCEIGEVCVSFVLRSFTGDVQAFFVLTFIEAISGALEFLNGTLGDVQESLFDVSVCDG